MEGFPSIDLDQFEMADYELEEFDIPAGESMSTIDIAITLERKDEIEYYWAHEIVGASKGKWKRIKMWVPKRSGLKILNVQPSTSHASKGYNSFGQLFFHFKVDDRVEYHVKLRKADGSLSCYAYGGDLAGTGISPRCHETLEDLLAFAGPHPAPVILGGG